MGSQTESRIASLRIAAQMNRRVTKEDPVPSAREIVNYAHVLAEYAYRGNRDADFTDRTKETP
jgi:hypothetical protein